MFEVVDFVGHRFLVRVVVRVEEHRVEAGHACTGDICLQVVADHEALGRGEAHFREGKVEDASFGFLGSGAL